MKPIRRVVVDVLKPHEPSNVELAQEVAGAEGVAGVNVTLLETDQLVQNVKLTVEGDGIEYGTLVARVEGLGGSVHSIDQVVCGDHLVEERSTPQDHRH